MIQQTSRRNSFRLLTAVALLVVAALFPQKASGCYWECWDSTWIDFAGDCFAGPPKTCMSCLLYCPKVV